eukprot:185080_1
MAVFQHTVPASVFSHLFRAGLDIDKAMAVHQTTNYRVQRPGRSRHVTACMGLICSTKLAPFDHLNNAGKAVVSFLEIGRGNETGLKAQELIWNECKVRIDALTLMSLLFVPARNGSGKKCISKLSMGLLPAHNSASFGGALIGVEGDTATISLADTTLNALKEKNAMFLTSMTDCKLTVQTNEPVNKPVIVKIFVGTWVESTAQRIGILKSDNQMIASPSGSSGALWDMLNGNT